MILDYLMITTVVKTIVDGIKTVNPPKWSLPLISIGLGVILTPVLTGDFSWAAAAHGFSVGAGAVGVHEAIGQLKDRIPPKS